ncbi:MAG: hypothetical protein M3342_08345 [Bacteroidota bacterium]|nr:hypothetical protein [Bacteroidota bacterium]
MRSVLLMGCLWALSIAAYAQGDGRVASGTPLRWSMNGSIEVMDPDLAHYYGSNDTATFYRRNSTPVSAALRGNPHLTRFASVQGLCHQNSVSLDWVAVQQFSADRYDIEQSADGRNWRVIGVVPANVTDLGDASYSFNYSRNVSNVRFRIVAVNRVGELVYSSTIESPCSVNSYLAVMPNPVFSTTTVRVGSPTAARVKLMLLNGTGTVVHNREVGLLPGINQVPLNMMSSMPRGYYTLFIYWPGGRQEVLKLIKQ